MRLDRELRSNQLFHQLLKWLIDLVQRWESLGWKTKNNYILMYNNKFKKEIRR